MNTIRIATAALVSAPLFATSLPAQADPGRLLAAQCAQCHGTHGGGPGFDEIAGKNANDLFEELIEMKYRPVEGIMDRQARGYSDAQLQLIADFLSTQPGNGDN